jgi:type I restriction enzyme S subunit
MDEWPQVSIGEVADIFDGPHATPVTVKSGPIFLGVGALQNGRINLGETRHVSPEDFKTWTRRVKPQQDDVVFSYETRLGEAAIIPQGFECCLGRRMGLVRARRSKLVPRFFLYFYLSPGFQQFLRSRTVNGATVDRIALKEFPSFPMILPPLREQHAIASILGGLDDMIELNRQMNETLEAMTRAIFKDWFVEFGPTRAKSEGRAAYLAPDIWALFPDRLDDDGKPLRWVTQRLGDILELAYGKSLTASERRSGSVPVYGSGGRTGWHDTALVTHGTIVVGRKGTVGSLYWEPHVCFPIDTVFYVRSKLPLVYCFRLLETLGLDTMNTDAAVPGLNRENAYRLKATLDEDLVKVFVSSVSCLQAKIDANLAACQTLAATRDLLLPKLMSGDISVREAEKIVEAAA